MAVNTSRQCMWAFVYVFNTHPHTHTGKHAPTRMGYPAPQVVDSAGNAAAVDPGRGYSISIIENKGFGYLQTSSSHTHTHSRTDRPLDKHTHTCANTHVWHVNVLEGIDISLCACQWETHATNICPSAIDSVVAA